jgi:hypothetical protein
VDRGQYLEVYDFDRCTGKFSNQRSIKYDNHYGAGVAFSPNSRFLYVSIGDIIMQYDMDATNLKASGKAIAKYDNFITCNNSESNFYNCQLAPDNKIYICTTGCTKELHVIEKPDLLDTFCLVKRHNIKLPTYTNSSLPNFPNFQLGKADCMMGTKDIEINVALYPNPAQEILHIDNDSTFANMELKIVNITGQLIATHDLHSLKSTIDVSGLANGIYYCQFKSNNKTLAVKRLIIIK